MKTIEQLIEEAEGLCDKSGHTLYFQHPYISGDKHFFRLLEEQLRDFIKNNS